MSIILNALRQQKGPDGQPQGFFWSKSQPSRFYFPLSRFVLGLTLLGLLSMGAIFYVTTNQSSRVIAPAVKAAQLKPVERNEGEEARQAFERGDFAGSIELFKLALKKTPDSWVLFNNLGLALTKVGRLDEAESYFFKAVAANVSCASCYNNLGDLEVKRNFTDEAELYYQKASKADPEYADPYFNLGVLYEQRGDFEAAADSYVSFLDRLHDKKSPLYQKVKRRLKEIQGEEGSDAT